MKTLHKKQTPSKSPAPRGARDDDLETLILITLPRDAGQHNAAVFRFARGLKGLPRYADKLLVKLKPIVRQWHARAVPIIGSVLFEDTWARFIESWRSAKKPLGDMAWIVHEAEHDFDTAESMQYEDPRKRQLLKVCRRLQMKAGSEEFYLDSATAGKIVGTDKKTAWTWLLMFEADGLLEVVKKGGRPKGGSALATTYRYLGKL